MKKVDGFEMKVEASFVEEAILRGIMVSAACSGAPHPRWEGGM
jgi:hypothetical protein